MTGGPAVYVTLRGDLALVRGVEAERAAHLVSPPENLPQWSPGGRGWVIPAALVSDVLAYAQDAHLLAVVSDVTERAAAS